MYGNRILSKDRNLTIIRYLLCFSVLILFFFQLSSQTLEVCVKNIRSTKGQLCVAIFKSDSDFIAEIPLWENKYCKSAVREKVIRFIVPVLPGRYGVSVLDDENNDGKMNYNIIGLPTEGFGFSNYIHKGIRKPKFKNFCFDVGLSQKIMIEVDMVYL